MGRSSAIMNQSKEMRICIPKCRVWLSFGNLTKELSSLQSDRSHIIDAN